MKAVCIGVDPGVTTGICGLYYVDYKLATAPALAQCSANLVIPVLRSMIAQFSTVTTVIACEKWVQSPLAGKTAYRAAGQVTKEVEAAVRELAGGSVRVVVRNAATVKVWSTDERLHAAGLLAITAPMARHCRDAGRHGLYAAVADLLVPDPFSKRARITQDAKVGAE